MVRVHKAIIMNRKIYEEGMQACKDPSTAIHNASQPHHTINRRFSSGALHVSPVGLVLEFTIIFPPALVEMGLYLL